MTMMWLPTCLVLLVAGGANAWGARKQQRQSCWGKRTLLLAQRESSEESFHRLRFENRLEENEDGLFLKRLFISEPTFVDATHVFGVANPYDEVVCQGDECDECPIPDEFKRIAEDSSINVMDYLGLQRVKPVGRPQWEEDAWA